MINRSVESIATLCVGRCTIHERLWDARINGRRHWEGSERVSLRIIVESEGGRGPRRCEAVKMIDVLDREKAERDAECWNGGRYMYWRVRMIPITFIISLGTTKV